jgi:hypothetical protein
MGRARQIWQATIVRMCLTVAAAFEYLDYAELTLARHELQLEALSDLVVVDAERRPIAPPVLRLQ